MADERELQTITAADVGTITISAGVMSAAHSDWDPPMGQVIEASDVAAILGVMAAGHGVASPEASQLILARKATGLQTVLAWRDAGASVETILAQIALAGPSWGT
jgi:hypothetical protein